MYYAVYLDEWFLRNLVMDYVLLRMINRIRGCSATRLRCAGGAAIGAAGSCLMFLLPSSSVLLRTLLVQIITNTCMVRFGCRVRGGRALVKDVCLLYFCAVISGGVFQVLLFWAGPAGARAFWFIAASGYLVIQAGFLAYEKLFSVRRKIIYTVVLCADGKCRKVKGLYDTGNSLWDTVSGKPVSVADSSVVRELFSEEMLRELSEFQSTGKLGEDSPWISRHLHFVPFQSVGQSGILPVFTLDYLCVKREDTDSIVCDPVIALSMGNGSFTGNYQLILNPDLIDR